MHVTFQNNKAGFWIKFDMKLFRAILGELNPLTLFHGYIKDVQ